MISTYVQAGPLKSALLQFWCIVFLLVIAVARPYRDDQDGDEPNEARRAGNHAAEVHRATGGESSDGNGAQGVANQGGNEAAEAQREENQAAPLNGLKEAVPITHFTKIPPLFIGSKAENCAKRLDWVILCLLKVRRSGPS